MSCKPACVILGILATSLTAFAPASGQSSLLLQLRTGVADRFKVDSAGGVVAPGTYGRGTIPATGSGARLMWYPGKAAFRAGSAYSPNWDDANTGNYSAAFGLGTTASGGSSLAAGEQTTAGGWGSLAMGISAYANGDAAVAMGFNVRADNAYAVALGFRASSNGYGGGIVMADNSAGDTLKATSHHQFKARYAGGYWLYTNSTRTAGAIMGGGASSWDVVSDRNRKQDFLGVNGEELLARLRSVPVTTWRYMAEENRTVRHIGPMAQDWEAAFGFSHDSTMINMSDLDGVNLAGVKALEERSRRQAARIEELELALARLNALEETVAELKRQLATQPCMRAPATLE